MRKKRAAELSDRQLELQDEPPRTAKSKYEASRKQTMADQDNHKLYMVESVFSQLKLKASQNVENSIPYILDYDNYEIFCIRF
jgi:hypothetical protein